MAEPTLSFLYNTSTSDTTYSGTGGAVDNWRVINTNTDTMVFTGGGILGELPTPTCATGSRDATIKPAAQSYIIPQTYVDTTALMYNTPLAGYGPSASQGPYRYAFAVYINGTMNSDIYIEAWDDATFSTTTSEVLTGTANSSSESFINAIRTTNNAPPWSPGWSGGDTRAEYLRGISRRLPLKNSSSVSDEAVYYNAYIRLETDTTTFHNTPIFGFRYLYT
ncbi:MAG: hypothetical protein DRP42_01500 [Tenericutes bacterium]|nr:MAG: hypothetical protein DRP42_01500 [Mycoplasmatota bacterium]